MKRKYELTDAKGRFIEAVLDPDKDLFKFTMYLSVAVKTEADIRAVFDKLGFTVVSQKDIALAKVIDFPKRKG